ncbi:helix-turn-helix domain-containing protein [Arthrobacter sp.]|uniref:AraC-like ligand-binding domain-containing protein n=1 Tax=Arthrobacter sp. TaxID=1667 RepID=UPI003A8F274E
MSSMPQESVVVPERPQLPSELAPESRVESFDAWKSLVGNRFGRLTLSTNVARFCGSLRSTHVDQTCVTEISASAHQVRRLASQIDPGDAKHLKLTLLLEGTGIVAQDGRTAVLAPGDLAIYDTSRPYTMEFDDNVHTLVMVFPHHMVGMSAKLIRCVTAVTMPGDRGIGRVISPFMEHLAANLEQLQGINGIRIMRSALDLITALLSAELVKNGPPVEDSRRLITEKLRLYIEAHLADPDLNSVSVAKAHFMSVRYLQYLFREQDQTVTGYIRERRLERCRLELLDPAFESHSILQIAARWGLVDRAHFSKLFKTAFGLSPRMYRDMHSRSQG